MKIITLIAFVFTALIASAQHEKVLEIRNYYKDVKSHSEYAQPDSISYYSDQIIRNSGNMQWRAIGDFHDTLTFWYSDLMNAAYNNKNQNNDSTWALTLVTSSTQKSILNHYQEWLFKDGKLVFYFDKMMGYDEESTWEYRYYFNNNKLIRTMSGGQIIHFDDAPQDVIKSSNEILHLFELLMRR